MTENVAGSLRVLQLSDCHLMASPGDRFYDREPDRSLEACVAKIAVGGWPADLVVVTGDIAHDPTVAVYERFRDIMSAVRVPVLCLPGNHDHAGRMREALNRAIDSPVSVPTHHLDKRWQIVLLDTTVPDQCAGDLQAGELQRLERLLSAAPDHYTLICLHHPPVPCGSRWMDETMLLRNPDALAAVIRSHHQVRCLIWGHIHQEFVGTWQGRRCYGAPSTVVQFCPASATFALDPLPPGCRWLTLFEDGGVETGILRLSTSRDFD